MFEIFFCFEIFFIVLKYSFSLKESGKLGGTFFWTLTERAGWLRLAQQLLWWGARRPPGAADTAMSEAGESDGELDDVRSVAMSAAPGGILMPKKPVLCKLCASSCCDISPATQLRTQTILFRTLFLESGP